MFRIWDTCPVELKLSNTTDMNDDCQKTSEIEFINNECFIPQGENFGFVSDFGIRPALARVTWATKGVLKYFLILSV